MVGPGFIKLNGNQPPGGRPGQPALRPPGQNRSMPLHQPHARPQAGGRGAMRPQVVQNTFPPGPPREALPVDVRLNRPVIQFSDITQRFLSDNDMRAKCTEYLAIRFEKMPITYYDDDDEDEERKSSWERAVKTQVQGLSTKDIIKEIRRLDMTTEDVVFKKSTLPPALLRQIDVAMDELARSDFDTANYVWTLAQFEQQFKKIDGYTAVRHKLPSRHRKSHSKRHGWNKKRRSRSAKSRKKYLERVSLTAYFKRSPRPHAAIRSLYEARERALSTTLGGPPRNNPGLPHMAGGPPNVPGGPPYPQANPLPHGGGRGAPPAPGSGRRPQGLNTQKPPINVKIATNKKAKSVSGDDSDSDSSSSSSSGSSTESGSSWTSQSSHSHKKRGRSRNRSQHRHQSRSPRQRSRAYGIPETRTHQKTYNNGTFHPIPPGFTGHGGPTVVVEDIGRVRGEAFLAGQAHEAAQRPSPPPPVPLPPPPLQPIISSASDISRIRDDAYRAGRGDGFREAAHDVLARDRAAEYDVHSRPRPRSPIIQQPPRNSFRPVDPGSPYGDVWHKGRSAGYSDDDLPRIERLYMADHDREYYPRQTRHHPSPRSQDHDFSSHPSLDGYEHGFMRTAGTRITQEQPYVSRRRQTTDSYGRTHEVHRTMNVEPGPRVSDHHIYYHDMPSTTISGHDIRIARDDFRHNEIPTVVESEPLSNANHFIPRFRIRKGSSFERRRS